MPSCSLIGCRSRYKKNQPLTIHRLPVKEKLRAKWLQIIGPNKFKSDKKIQHICSDHFTESCFNRTLNKITLHDDAYPTIFDWPPGLLDSSSVENSAQSYEIPEHQTIKIISDVKIKPALDGSHTNNKGPLFKLNDVCHSPVRRSKLSRANFEIPVVNVNEEGKVISRSFGVQTDPIKINQPNPDKEREINRPLEQLKIAQLTRKLDKMTERRLEQRKRVKLLDRRCKLRDAKIAKLEAKLKEFDVPTKQDIESELVSLRGALDEYAGPEGLLERQIRKKKGLSLDRLYTPGLRKFALTLHCISPQAYNFVRESYGDCLPHPRTLMSWTIGARPITNIDTTS